MSTSRRSAAIALLLTAVTLGACSAGPSNRSTSEAAPAKGGPAPYAPVAPAAPDAAAGNAMEDRAGFAGEIDPDQQPLSTFAVDVDTASYGYARNLISQGQRPQGTDVRPEEFINAFQQGYPQPDGDGFSVNLDGARLPTVDSGNGGDAAVRLLRVGLRTRDEDPAERTPAALTFVIDVSGSMGEPGKLDMVKQALDTLIDQLRPDDSVAIVTFDSHARVIRSMTAASRRAELRHAVDGLEVGGSTDLEAGLVTGYKVAREGFRAGITNRVILLSDGLANTGDTAAQPILRQVREEAAKQIALLGVGVGDDYGDALMEQLADQGDGFVVYVSELSEARRIFVQQLPATLAVRALDAKVQVRFDPETVAGYRLIGYDDRALAASAFRNDRVDGGEVGPGHSVTALYTVRLRAGAEGTVAEARVRWQDPRTREASEAAQTVTVDQLDTPFVAASPRLRVCYAAAYLAEYLRSSPYAEGVRLADLAAIASGAAEETADPQVSELATMIRQAGQLD